MRQASRYPLSVSLLHWLLAAALIGNLAIGWMLDDDFDLLALHRSIGIVILGFVLIRLSNRLRLRRQLPPSANAAGTLSYFAEKTVHCVLYLAMLVIPLLGWLKTNAAGHVVNCFGVFSLPTLVPKSLALSHSLGVLHSAAAYGLAVLLGVHVVGALVHWLMKSENVLLRILPWPDRSSRPE
jgi:cytochrome b561